MQDASSPTPSPHFSRRARRRADAQLYVPERIRHGARVSSRAPRSRPTSRSLRFVAVALVLVAGEMLVAPELARESSGGSAAANVPTNPLTATGAAGTIERTAPHVTTSAGETISDAAERAVVALLARLSDARQLAARTQQSVTIVLDPATGRLWRMAGDDPDAQLASDGAIPLGGQVTLASSAARPSFTFSADEVEADSVWVRDGVTRVAVVLDPRSGEPRANR